MTTPICYANYLEASEGKISYSMEKTEIEVKKRTGRGQEEDSKWNLREEKVSD